MSRTSSASSFSWSHWLSLVLVGGLILSPALIRLYTRHERTPAVELPRQVEPADLPVVQAKTPSAVATTDTDSDGIPDDWELSHFLNPNDATDANSDFDVDGVTALEEYLNGTNPLGKWKKQGFAPPTALAGATIQPVRINDAGQLLVIATNVPGSSSAKTYLVQTPANTWSEIVPPGAVTLGDVRGQDLNDRGDLIVRWHDSTGDHCSIRTAGSGQFTTLTKSGYALTAFRINNYGEWVGMRDFDHVPASNVGGSVIVDELAGNSYACCDINDFGEIVGTASTGIGVDSVFLLGGGTMFTTGLPGSYPFFDPTQGAWNIPSALNDDGIFGGSVSQMSTTRIYLYDGHYHSFTTAGTWPSDSAASLDDSGRLLTYSGSLYRSGIAVPLNSLNPEGNYALSSTTISHSGAILSRQSSSSILIVLTPDQDQDGDGMSDDWEDIHGLAKDFAGDATADPDNDGVNNLGEYLLGRNPNLNEDTPVGSPAPDLRPGVDTDGDGMPNVWEWEHGLDYQDASDAESNPLTYKTDPDRDGYSNLQEYKLGTDPNGAPAFRVKELGVIPFASSLDYSKITLGSDKTADQLIFSGTRSTVSPTGSFPLRWMAQRGSATGAVDWFSGTTLQGSILATSPSGAVVAASGGSLTYWESQNKPPVTVSGVATDTAAVSDCVLSPNGKYLAGRRLTAYSQTWVPFIWPMGDTTSYGVPYALPLPAGITQIDFSSLKVNDFGYATANGGAAGNFTKSVVWKRGSNGYTISATILTPVTSGAVTSVIGLSNSPSPILGGSSGSATRRRAVRWSADGAVTEFNASPSADCGITAISPSGIMAGFWGDSSSATRQCFIASPASNGQWSLRVQGPASSGVTISSVNDGAEAFGYAGGQPTIWRNGSAYPLANLLPSGVLLSSVDAFNANGSFLVEVIRGGRPVYLLLSQDVDTDSDGMPDAYENEQGFNSFSATDAAGDADADGLTNLAEFRSGTDPNKKDTDNDGMDDKWELDNGLDPLNGEDAYLDPDGDGVTNAREYVIKTCPTGYFKYEAIPLAVDEYFKSIDDRGSIVTLKGAPHIKDRNYNNIPNVIGNAFFWRGFPSGSSIRVEKQIPFGGWDPSETQAASPEYHSTYVFPLGNGKVAGFHLGYDLMTFQPLPGGMNVFTFDANSSTPILNVKDWSTLTSTYHSPSSWSAVVSNAANSPTGNRRIVGSSIEAQMVDELGAVLYPVQYKNPTADSTDISWRAVNNKGDALGLLLPNLKWVWRKSGQNSPLRPIEMPTEWGADTWNIAFSFITDDNFLIIDRYRAGENGEGFHENYFYNLESGEADLINFPGTSTSEHLAAISSNGRLLGAGLSPWIVSNGSTMLLNNLNITATTRAASQKFSQLGWTIESLDSIDPAGRISVTVRTSASTRQVVIFTPILDENHNGISDDYEVEMRHFMNLNGVVLNPNTDYDGDGLTLAQEMARGTSDASSSSRSDNSQSNPDSDGDGVPDNEDADPNDPVIDWHKPDCAANFALVEVFQVTDDKSVGALDENFKMGHGTYWSPVPQLAAHDINVIDVSEQGALLLGSKEVGNSTGFHYDYIDKYRASGNPVALYDGDPVTGGVLGNNKLARIDSQGNVLGVATFAAASGQDCDGDCYLTTWNAQDGKSIWDDSQNLTEEYFKHRYFNSHGGWAAVNGSVLNSSLLSKDFNLPEDSTGSISGFTDGGLVVVSYPPDETVSSKIGIYNLASASPSGNTIESNDGNVGFVGIAYLANDHDAMTIPETRDLVLTDRGLYVAAHGGDFRKSSRGESAAFVSRQGWLLYRGGEDGPQLWADGTTAPLGAFIDPASFDKNHPIQVKIEKVLNMTEAGLITAVATLLPDSGGQRRAIVNLFPVDVTTKSGSQESEAAADAAAPDDFRKISLSGVSKSEPKPQSESESDLAGESTYVDAYTRLLHHDTSHVYQPVPSSDLALQATMSWEGMPISIAAAPSKTKSNWNPNGVGAQSSITRSVEESLGRDIGLLGAGWGTNLGAVAKVEYVFKNPDSKSETNNSNNQPNTVSIESITLTISDESGRSYTFLVLGDDAFRQKPAQFPRKADLGTTLHRDGDHLILKKKFGTTCTYNLPTGTPPFSGTTLPASSRTEIKAKLSMVTDSHQNSLIFTTPDLGVGSVEVAGKPQLKFSYNVSSLSSSSRHASFKLVDRILDPLGKITRFEYEWMDVVGSKIPVLARVIKSDGSIQKYDYGYRLGSLHFGGDDRVDNLTSYDVDNKLIINDPTKSRIPKVFTLADIKKIDPRLTSLFTHLNLTRITNPIGAAWSIEYEQSPREDLVCVNPNVLAAISRASDHEGANITDEPSGNDNNGGPAGSQAFPLPPNIYNQIATRVKNEVWKSAAAEYGRAGGVELKLPNTGPDEHTGVYVLPAASGADVVKKVRLPDSTITTFGSEPRASRPLPSDNVDAGKIYNYRADPSLPIRGVSRKPGYTSVKDAAGNETDYLFTGPLFLSQKSKPLGTVKNDADKGAFSLLAYETLEIRSYGKGVQPKVATYKFDANTGFALSSTLDHQGNAITYLHENDLLGQVTGRYGDDSGWSTVAYVNAISGNPSPAGRNFPEPSAEVHGFLTPGHTNTFPTKTFKYDAASRKMSSSIDRNGNETVDTIFNGLRTMEESYLGNGSTRTLLSRQSFVYGENGAPASFLTTSMVKNFTSATTDPLDDWVRDIVTTYHHDSLGHVESQTTYPDGLGGTGLTTHYAYDVAGRKLSETDPRGNTTNFAYDDIGHLIQVTYPSVYNADLKMTSRPIKTFQYDAAGRKIAETDERGNSTLWSYDIMGRVIATGRDMNGNGVLDSTDIVTRTEYNAVGLPIRVTDPNKNVTVTAYDDFLRPISITDPLGGVTRMAYDAPGSNSGSGLANGPGYKPTRIRNPRGYVTIRKYDDYYRLVSEQVEFRLPGDHAEGDQWSGDDWLTRNPTREYATLTETVYDPNGNPTVTRSYRDSTHIVESHTGYDGLNRATSVTTGWGLGDLESTTLTRYSSTGLKKETVAYSGLSNLECITRSEYDGAGRLTKVWSPNPADGTVTRDPALNSFVLTTYDGNGNVKSTSTSRGTTTSTASDGIISIVAATSATTTTEYDARNRPVDIYSSSAAVYIPSDSCFYLNQEAHVRKYYDRVGNVVQTTDPRGQITVTDYDGNNRATSVTVASSNTYSSGTVLAGISFSGTTTSTSYDRNGNIIAVTDANSAITRNQYDRLNRLVATAVNPTNGNPSTNLDTPAIGDVTVRNSYDATGNLIRVLDGEGMYWPIYSAHTTDFTYDGLNRKIAQTWDKGAQSWGAYTPKGTLKWTYDPLVMTESFNARGEKTTYTYDGLLRPLTQTYSNVATTPICLMYYLGNGPSYADGYRSGPGPLIASVHSGQAANGLYTDTYSTYDHLGRLTSETSSGETHLYGYDISGNRNLITYARTGRKLVTQYDTLGRVTRIIDTSSPISNPAGYNVVSADLVTSYAYDIGGLVLRKNQANHTATINTYDFRGRLATTRTRYYPPGGGGCSSTNTDLSAFDYSQPQLGSLASTSGYDALGNVIHVVETYSGLPSRDVLNSYDRTNRLITEQDIEGGHTTLTSYIYTENNSRYEKHVCIDNGGDHGTRYRYGNPNIGYNSDQLYGISKLDVNPEPGDDSTFKYRYTYDADGNRATRVTDPGTPQAKTDTYIYDQRNRLIRIDTTVAGTLTNISNYAYDERTRRIRTIEGFPSGSNRRLSFSGGNYVQEYGSATNSLPTLQLVRGSDMGGGVGGILYHDAPTGLAFSNYNSRGDVVSQTNTGGAATWAGKYDAFGTHTDSTANAVGRQRANSKDEDPTGLLNEGMRYRDLDAGVFLTRDPAGLVEGPNVYTYVRQNPWTKFDPKGLAGDDPSGVVREGHHRVTVKAMKDHHFSDELVEELEKWKVPAGRAHGMDPHQYSRAHIEYNKRSNAIVEQTVNMLQEEGVDVSKATKESARDIAKQMIDQIQSDAYSKAFNEGVWNGKTTKELNAMLDAFPADKLDKVPGLSGKVLSEGAGVIGKVAKGVAKHLGVITTAATFFVGVAKGGTVYDESMEAVMSATGGDIARWALTENGPTKEAARAIQNHENNPTIRDAARMIDEYTGSGDNQDDDQ